MENSPNYRQMLEEYRKLWQNRQLKVEHSPEETLKEAIRRELNDENTHPRVRKSVAEKYEIAKNRILSSSLSNEVKQELMKLYDKIRAAIE